MKILYLECGMGAAGDMLMSALSEICSDEDKFVEKINEIGIPNVKIEKRKDKKCGITGTHISVKVGGSEENEEMHDHSHHDHSHSDHSHNDHSHHDHSHSDHSHSDHHHSHSHHHTSFEEIEMLINNLKISEKVKKDAVNVYRIIAEAEGHAHGCEIKDIHFHEVGTMDAVADIVGVCMLFEEIGADKIIASPVNTGGGYVKCAHGILPVPAPATAYILKGIPFYSDSNEGEMCTPTGAALLKYFVSEFKNMPVMKTEKIGYGLGTKEFKKANILRVFLGEEDDTADEIAELRCNVDDMSGEEIAFAQEMLFEKGALDVFTTAIGMKKGRPAVMISCLCSIEKKSEMAELLFKYTTTLGVRENISKRYILKRNIETINTKYGDIRVKKSYGYGISKVKAEYDDIEKAAKKYNVSIFDIKREGNL